MARVRHIREDDPRLAEQIAAIKARRDGKLINLYRVLLHTPEIIEPWVAFNAAARFHPDVDPIVRELVILRVAHLSGSEYQAQIHAVRYAPECGVTPAQIEGVRDWEPATCFTPRQRAVLAYTDAMTRDIDVPDAVFDALRPHYTESAIVTLTILIAAYIMHCRVGRALRIDPENFQR